MRWLVMIGLLVGLAAEAQARGCRCERWTSGHYAGHERGWHVARAATGRR